MKFIIFEILKGNLIVLISYFISFIFEKITGFVLLWWNLRQRKNEWVAKGAALLAAIYYFVVNIIVLFNDLRKYSSDPEGYSFIKWFVIIIPLTIIFAKIHFKLTPIDPNKGDRDITD